MARLHCVLGQKDHTYSSQSAHQERPQRDELEVTHVFFLGWCGSRSSLLTRFTAIFCSAAIANLHSWQHATPARRRPRQHSSLIPPSGIGVARPELWHDMTMRRFANDLVV